MTAAGWALLAASVAVFATRYPRTRWQPLVVAATFAYGAILPASLALLLFVLSGTPWWAIAAAVLVAEVAVELRPWLRRRGRGNPVLIVLTANVWFGQGQPESLLSVARARDADVIALQEITHDLVAALREAGIDSEYPHSVVAAGPRWTGAALWSRRPLRDPVTAHRGTLKRVTATVTVGQDESPDDPRITSVHIHAPWPGAPGPWLEQLDEVRHDFADATGPTIVAGDFNATLDHAAFRSVLTEATDAAVAAGAWATRTWPTHLPGPRLIAIDHVLLRGLSASSVHVDRIPGADHAALTATVVSG